MESIGYAAFSGTAIITLSIPDSVTSLDSFAFSGCGSLTTISTGNGINYIGEGTFRGCHSLTSVTFGNKVGQIDYNAFANCIELESIRFPESVVYIGTTAFDNCKKLTNITFAKSEELIIIDDAFKGCGAIQNIYYEGDINSYVLIGGHESFMTDDYTKPSKKIFIGGQLLTEVNITTATYINDYVFRGYSYLTSVVIGDSVEIIGKSAFENCSNLTSVTIGNGVTDICEDAFYHCLELSTLSFGNKLETIGDSAFYSCLGLTSLTIPDSVKTIGDYAFDLCTNISSLTLGNKVESIGTYAFDTCKITTLVIPDSVKTIGSFAFSGSRLLSVTIGRSVTSIGSNAFNNEQLVEVINRSDLNITKGSTNYGQVGYYALNIKTSGTSDIVTMGDYLFYTVEDVNYLLRYNGSSVYLTLPENYNGQSYKIYSRAFNYCKNLISLNLGNGVIGVANDAFCASLVSLTIGPNVVSMADFACSNCDKLIEIINLSSLENSNFCANGTLNYKNSGTSELVKVGDYFFYTYNDVNYLVGYVGNASELTLPEDYNGQNYDIYRNAFGYCTSLTSVTINGGVKNINERAFYCCTSLTSVSISNSVESIGDEVFNGCDNLQYNEYENGYYLGNTNNPYLWLIKAKSSDITTCIVKDGCKSIPASAFSWCEELTTIVVPESVTRIGNFAFFNCDKLETIFYKGTATDWEEIDINLDYNLPIKVFKVYYYTETEPVTEGKFWHFV